MLASLLLAVAGLIGLGAVALWLYVSFGVEEWTNRRGKK